MIILSASTWNDVWWGWLAGSIHLAGARAPVLFAIAQQTQIRKKEKENKWCKRGQIIHFVRPPNSAWQSALSHRSASVSQPFEMPWRIPLRSTDTTSHTSFQIAQLSVNNRQTFHWHESLWDDGMLNITRPWDELKGGALNLYVSFLRFSTIKENHR